MQMSCRRRRARPRVCGCPFRSIRYRHHSPRQTENALNLLRKLPGRTQLISSNHLLLGHWGAFESGCGRALFSVSQALTLSPILHKNWGLLVKTCRKKLPSTFPAITYWGMPSFALTSPLDISLVLKRVTFCILTNGITNPAEKMLLFLQWKLAYLLGYFHLNTLLN